MVVETRNIIFLGASYAGLGASHYFLKHVHPHLPTDQDITYKAILIDPSAKWYLRHASPRAVVSAEIIPADKLFLDIEPGYRQYGDKVEFVQGKATSWDETSRTLTLSKADGSEVRISLDSTLHLDWIVVAPTASSSLYLTQILPSLRSHS